MLPIILGGLAVSAIIAAVASASDDEPSDASVEEARREAARRKAEQQQAYRLQAGKEAVQSFIKQFYGTEVSISAEIDSLEALKLASEAYCAQHTPCVLLDLEQETHEQERELQTVVSLIKQVNTLK